MNNHLIGRDATLSVQVDGEWVSVGTVGNFFDDPKVVPVAVDVVLINDRVFELIRPAVIMGKRLKPILAKCSPITNKLFDRWGRLK